MYFSKPSRFVRNSGTGNAVTSYLACKTMSCDENSFKNNKQTRGWSETENSLFHASICLDQWCRQTFLSSVVEAETSRCLWRRNLRVQPVQFCDGFLLSCETFNDRSVAVCMILRDSSTLVSLFLFCTLGVELYTQDFVKFLRRFLFQDAFFKIYFQDGGIGTSFGGLRSFTVLWCGSKDYICLFTVTELSSCIASFETTGNLETCTFLRWLWICCCVVFVCLFCWTRYHTDLEQTLKKKRQNIPQNGHWMLETSCKVGLHPEGAHCHHSETVIESVILFWKKKR